MIKILSLSRVDFWDCQTLFQNKIKHATENAIGAAQKVDVKLKTQTISFCGMEML